MRKKFNLIELVAVIAIIGILASIVIPNIGEMQARANKTAVENNVRNIQIAVDHFSMERNGAMPTAEMPTVNIPQRIDFAILGEEFLRNTPREGATYWLDASGRVWASTVGAPGGVAVSMAGVVTWSPVSGAVSYTVYEVVGAAPAGTTSVMSLAVVAEGLTETTFAGEAGRVYVVSAVDLHGLPTVPTGPGFVAEAAGGGAVVPVGAPVAVIGMTPSDGVFLNTVVTWSAAGSSAFGGRTIAASEWRLNGGVASETPPAAAVMGENTMELRVQDSSGAWSPWVQRVFVVENRPPVAVIGMTPGTGLTEISVITWSHAGSSDPDGQEIVDVEWRNAVASYAIGTHTAELRVQDASGAWSPWVQRVFVVGAVVWDAVSAFNSHTLALRSGQLWAWGHNASGQLGVGSNVDQPRPVRVGGYSDWSHISAGGFHSLAIRGGLLYAWGESDHGRLGTGHSTDQPSPRPVLGGHTNWVNISAGETHSLAIRGGQLFAWGAHYNGRLGTGNTSDQASPQPVLGGHTNWANISAGGAHSLGLRGGRLYAWGESSGGLIGTGHTTDQTSPQPVLGGHTNWVNISAGSVHSLAIRGGQLFTWGWADSGRLGTGHITDQTSPQLVTLP